MDIFSYSEKELVDFFISKGEKSFRAKQVYYWLYQKRVNTFDEMTNLSKGVRDLLKDNFSFSSLSLKNKVLSADKQTYKFLWKLEDGLYVESVLIFSKERRTLCLSSQVGCKRSCVFCASGKEGFKRNLKVSEIIEQIINIEKFLNERGETVSNIVFMGMGEPLDNFNNVCHSISIINEKDGLNISLRRITVSTVGVTDKILELINENGPYKDVLKVNLTLSLHAPNQEIRKELMPAARQNDLYQLLDAMKRYYIFTRRDITFEYILIKDVNDKEIHAQELAKLLSKFFSDGRHFLVNLIPYNKVFSLPFQRPSGDTVNKFKMILEKANIKVSQRYTKGDDVAAACGQLAFIQD